MRLLRRRYGFRLQKKHFFFLKIFLRGSRIPQGQLDCEETIDGTQLSLPVKIIFFQELHFFQKKIITAKKKIIFFWSKKTSPISVLAPKRARRPPPDPHRKV